MKIPENLNHNSKHWDRYNAFAWNIGGPQVVLFDTGELIVTQCHSNVRSNYCEVGVEITCTGPEGIRCAKTPDGREIKQTWITENGLQEVLIDHDSGRIVSLETMFKKGDPRVPARFAKDKSYGLVRAYIGGPGLPPVGAGQIAVCPPVGHMEWFTPEQVEKVKDMQHAIKALFALEEERQKVHAGALSCERLLAVTEFMDLTAAEMAHLWKKGIPRPRFLFDYLLVS